MSLKNRICKILLDERVNLGLSAKDVSVSSGLTTSAICHIEKGRHGVSIESLEAICDALNIKVSTVVSRAEKK